MYHLVVAVRYPNLCKFMRSRWEFGSFASGGISRKPPGYQFILWDTNATITGLVAADLETLVSQVLSEFPYNTGFADGLFVMTTATDHKNNLNRSLLQYESSTRKQQPNGKIVCGSSMRHLRGLSPL